MPVPTQKPNPRPQNQTRLWQLEALRGLAAFYVLLHHISSSDLHLKHSIGGQAFRFGQEAVLVFFLLSGLSAMPTAPATDPGTVLEIISSSAAGGFARR